MFNISYFKKKKQRLESIKKAEQIEQEQTLLRQATELHRLQEQERQSKAKDTNEKIKILELKIEDEQVLSKFREILERNSEDLLFLAMMDLVD